MIRGFDLCSLSVDLESESLSKLGLKRQLPARTPSGTLVESATPNAQHKDVEEHATKMILTDESKVQEASTAVEDEGPKPIHR